MLEPVPITGAYTARHVADRDHISIIELAGNYDRNLDAATSNFEPRAVVAREFFRTHPDDYDFLVAFSTFEFDTGDARALHWGVQNEVLGIGLPQYDNTELFGSQGKLQGYIDMAALTRWVTDALDPDFETVLSVLAHEMLHQWAAKVHFKDSDGNISDALLGRDGAHWSFLLNSGASVEYGNLWKDNGDGSFTSIGQRKFFSPLDLYLMGFYKPEEVPPFFLIENPSVDKTRLPEENVTITGTKRWVTIDDIIAAEGPRVPSAENTQKDFRLGFVLLTGPGQSVSDAQVAALNNIRNAFMTRFAVLSGGRGVAQIYPEAMPDLTAGQPTPVTGDELRTDPTSIDAALAWLRGQQLPEGHWLDKATTDVRDTTLTLQALTKLDPAFSNAASTLEWLTQHPSHNTDYLARYAIALHEIGGDASALRTQLASRQNGDGGFGIAPGYRSDPLDTALALFALSGGNETSTTALESAAQYLIAQQNGDGGFSPAEGGPSRTSVTTTALTALKAVNQHATVAPAALAFLSGKQNPDGGFGDSPSTVHDTANVLQALMAFEALSQIEADSAADFLLGRQTVSGSWEGSVYSTASAVMALKRFKYPNWAVLSVTAEPVTVNDGDRIQLTVRVRNDSNATAPEGVLRIYDGDPSQGGVASGADITIPTMAGGTQLVFTQSWDSFDGAGEHTLYAVVDPENVETEMSERDNRNSVDVTVDPAPEGVDLTFGEISAFPVKPNRLPTTMSISVGVRNLGLTDVENARVVLWDGEPGSGTLVGETTLNVLSRSTVVANFSYVLNRSGRVILTAEVDPDNAVAEVSETNNTIWTEIYTDPSIDLVILDSDVTLDKTPAFVGDDVTFKVTIRNEGTSDTSSTDVRYLVTDGTTTRELLTNSIQLAAGQSTEQTVTWRVDLSGSLTFTAQVDPDNLLPELDEANNTASLDFSAGEPSGVNLAISYTDFTFTPNPGREGYPAVLSVLVRNTGTETATNAEIAFYNGDPAADNTYIGSHIIPSLGAGESTHATFTWQAIPNSGDKLMFAVADPANAITEFSEEDNTAFNVLPVLSLPDLAISAGDIQLTPLYPKAGDTISISVRVSNLGAQEASHIALRMYDGDPASGGALIGETSIAEIAGYGTGFAEASWNPSDAKLYNLLVQVDPDDAILERTKDNNSVSREIFIQDDNLNVTQKYFSPNGDGVKDTTQLFFAVQGAGSVEVQVINKRDMVVRRFAVPVAEGDTGANITWDGLDDLGRLVQDGPYRLRVVDVNNPTISEAVVHLDTNRSSLLEAVGTPYESYTNLTCDLPDVSGFVVTDDDSKVFFAIPSAAPDAIYPKGVYRMEGDGTDVRPIIPNTWQNFETHSPSGLLAAGNGSRILFSVDTNPPSYWVADGDGRNLTPLNYATFSGGQMTPWYISQDGTVVYVLEYNTQTGMTRLLGIQNGGTGEIREIASFTGMPQLSPGAGSGYSSNEIEPNDPIASAQYVSAPDGTVTIDAVLGVVSGVAVPDLDFYRFYGREGDLVTLDIDCGMSCGQRSVDTMLYLFGEGPSYQTLAARDDASIDPGSVHHYDSRIDNFRLPYTGYYTVGVTNYPRWLSAGGIPTNNDYRNGDYTLIISGISSAPLGANSAFSPDDSRVALLTQGDTAGWVLSIVDLKTGATVRPLGEGNEIHGLVETRWAPNSKRLAVSDTENQRILVFGRNGSLVREFSPADVDGIANISLRNLEWSSSGTEFAFRAFLSGSTGSSGQPGGLYFADLATGDVGKAAGYRNSSAEEGFDPWGSLYWVPGERSLLYREGYQEKDTAILLDEDNLQKPMFKEWAGDFSSFFFSPTGRQAIFGSSRAAQDVTSACYQQGQEDFWSFKSLLNLTADLRAFRSVRAGGIQLRGTAADANFEKYQLDYAWVEAPDDWRPVAPPAGEMVVDSLYTTWIPPEPGNYLIRLTVEDLAGNVRRTIKRVSWSDSASITDVYRTPAIVSPNGDAVNDEAILHYRVLEPVHLTFEFFNEDDTRVRVITRDHSTYGVDYELLWDGRDESGLVVPDGRYRMTVQNYEFFVTVDNTPPDTLIEVRDAYQEAEITDPNDLEGPKLRVVSVDPGIFWKATDQHLDDYVIESGVGADPFEWDEQALRYPCNISPPPGDDDPACNGLSLSEFTGHRFRVQAIDSAGNRSVSVTSLPAEQLIVDGFGNQKKAPAESGAGDNEYFRLSHTPYVPMTDTNGGSQSGVIDLNPVRFSVVETIARPIAQVFVQYRPADDPAWRESVLDQFMVSTGSSADYEKLAATESVTDQTFHAIWNMEGIEGGKHYVVRLRSVDSLGQEFYSNTFRFYADGIIFLGKDSSSIPADIMGRLLSENPPASGDYLLWGKEFVAEEIEEVRLIISSTDDPRYAIPQEAGVVFSPDTAFVYLVNELETCKTYTGYLEATTVPRFDSVSGAVVSRILRSSPQEIKMPCLALRVKTEVVPGTVCGEPSRHETVVKFAPAALDGKTLKLLTLSQPLPDNSGEDILFNVNNPDSVFLPTPPAEPAYIYNYTLNTEQYPEGYLTLTAKLLNVDDEETVVSVPVKVDHTPPIARLTYPLEGQRLCGIPKQMPDGTTRNTLTFEGELVDAGGFDYTLALGEGAEPASFSKFHDSRTLDSFRTPPAINPPRSAYGLFNVAGPIGQIYDRNGEFTVRLEVSDAGGYKRCESRTFHFDGVVEGASARIDRRLFSPNGDDQFDEVVLTYGADEAVTIDVDLYRAVSNGYGNYSIVGDKLRVLQSQETLLSGEGQLSWDGRDESGNVVADGWYALSVTITDACGNVRTINLFTEVDATPPAVSVAYPAENDPLSLVVEIQGDVNDPHLLNYRVEIGADSDPESWMRIANNTVNTQGTKILATWNTYGLEGPYTIRVVAVDVVGNTRTVEVPVNLAERVDLISYLEAVPDLFSPNEDGRLESTGIRFGLEENGLITLAILDASGVLKRTIYDERAFNYGPISLSWDGRDDEGNVLSDGRYAVSLLVASADNPLLRQDEKITVVIDKTMPHIDVTRPVNGFISANGTIVGTIQDANIAEFDVSITSDPEAPNWLSIDSGTTNRINSILGSVNDQEEGDYALKIEAFDLGEIRSAQIIPFTIDRTPPKVAITNPEANSVFGSNKSPITVTGTLEEAHLANYELSVGNGAAPTTWVPLVSGNSLPLPDVLREWDISAANDGVYTLRLRGEDMAGNAGESRVAVTVDNTAPRAAITSPADGTYVTAPQNVTGTATDANFAQFRLEIAPGTIDEASRWSELNVGLEPVEDGTLLQWETLPADGVYTLRLVVQDVAENASAALSQITVDSTPPLAPINLVAVLENGNDVRLTWDAVTDDDLAGYAIYRDGARINGDLVAEATYYDENLIEGRYAYTLKAVDRAGWESEPSNEAVIVMDATPPTTRISAPSSGSTTSGLVDIKGTAFSDDDFKEYRLYVGNGLTSTDYQLLVRSPVPVLADVLAQWNTLVLEEGADFTLKLEAEDINGNIGVDQITVKVDNMPPAAPTGLAAAVNDSDVTLTWDANSEPDLLGYLVFRNDRLANLNGVLVGSLKPYAVLTTDYADLSLGDGLYSYFLLAIDEAGNISDPSTAVEVSIDTRAPHVEIVQPAADTSFDNPLYVLGSSADTDIATVIFQYRLSGTADWMDLAEPDTMLPYETTFAPAALGLGYGDYELRAVAVDQGGRVDPEPTPITVHFKDMTSPSAVRGLTTLVNGGDVNLTWAENTEADLAGYHVDRRSSSGITVRVTDSPITQNSYTDSGLADDAYTYTVTALDAAGNSADLSSEAPAIVYTPTLVQPFTVTTDAVMPLNGSGIGPAVVSGNVVSETGDAPIAPFNTNAEGEFATQLTLEQGLNTITVRLTDAYGNVSKPGSIEVTYAQPPSKPTGLAADVTGYNVALTWNANPETDVVGYRVFREGEPSLSAGPVAGLIATASSEWSGYGASNAVDIYLGSYWLTAPAAGQWLAVDLPSPSFISAVQLTWYDEYYRSADFDIEVWTGSAWLTVAEIRDNPLAENSITFAVPYWTEQVRVVIRRVTNVYNYVVLRDIKVISSPLTPITSFNDVVTDGLHSYTVSAVNVYGLESEQSEPATAAVGDTTPPDPLTLNASVAGADVTLSWLPSSAPDVASYAIYRDGILIATLNDASATEYLDAGLINGTYSYVVKAIDTNDNESEPSNEATATVEVTPPLTPVNLTVTSVASGNSLELTWMAGGEQTVAGYRIYRSTVENGPYDLVDTVTETHYLDTGLVNGTVYYYVIAALDELGNVSDHSNEASGIPLDQIAPYVSITHPAAPGNTYWTNSSSITVAGLSEAGASVAVFRNGLPAGGVTASSEVLMNAAQLQLSAFHAPLSPNGRYIASHRAGAIAVYDLVAGRELPVSSHQYWGDPALNWTRDGERLLYVDFDAAAGGNVLRAYNPSDRTIDTVIAASEFADFRGAIDSTKANIAAVLGEKDSMYGLWKYNLESGAAQLLRQLDHLASEIDIATVRWSPNGRKLAYVVYSPWFITDPKKVEIADVTSGIVSELEPTAVSIRPSWSSDSTELLYTAMHNGTQQVWRHRLADNLSEVMTQGPDAHTGPSWLPDSSAFTSVENNSRMVVHDRDGGATTLIEEPALDGRYTEWTDSGYFALRTATGVLRIAPAGRFELRGIELEPGDNVFTAIARDASGNASAPSMPVVVNYDMGDLPDLALSAVDIRVLPSPTVIGNTTRISVTVRNEGALSSPNSRLSLIALGENGEGQLLLNDALVAAMQPQGAFTLLADWTPAVAGTYTIVATVDAANEVVESNESNNYAMRDVVAAGEAAPAVTVALERTAIGPNETLSGSVTLANSGDSVSGTLVIAIEDEEGYLVQTLSSQQVTVDFSDSQTFQVNWASGSTFAGIYRVSAELLDSQGALLVRDRQSFTLNSASDFTADVATDRPIYGANANAVVSGQATYLAGNAIVTDARLNLAVVDANGVVINNKTETLGDLMPGAENSITMIWNTGLVVGEYTAQLKLEAGESVLASAQSTFIIESTGPILKGSLTLSDSSPAPGTPQQATYTLENVGNTPATDKPIKVDFVDTSGNVIGSETRLLDLAPGGRTTDTVSFATTGLSLANYRVLLQAEVNDSPDMYETLAAAGFTLVDRMAPAIAISSPAENGYIASDARAVVFARDEHSSIARVEIRIDGGSWLMAPVHDAAQSLYSTTLPVMQEGAHALEARATDAYGNIALAGPILFTVDNTPPEISVTGVSNGGLYNHDVSANVTITDANLVEMNVSLNGAPYAGELLSNEGDYELSAQARDAAGNMAQITWWFAIDKTAPVITIDGVEEGGLYRVPVTPLITISDRNLSSRSVTLNGEPYASGTLVIADGLYMLVVAASDGATNSSTASVSFEIDSTPPDAPVVTYPGEGETVNDRLIDVTGMSEPEATVYLVRNNTETAVFTDSTGAFLFPQVSFDEGPNSFAVHAKDRAGNVGPATTVNFYVVTAELTGSVHAPNGVLVFLPNTDATVDAPLQVLIESALKAGDSDYLVVHEETAFLSALRTNRYAVVLMAELHPGCDKTATADCSRRGTQLKLSIATEQELRASIAAGTGLIWIKPDSDANEHFRDVLGAKPRGLLPNPNLLALEASPACDAGEWELSGVALDVESERGIAVGQLAPYDSPALILNSYGDGPVALVTFDPSALADTLNAQALLERLVSYASPVKRALLPGGLAEVGFRAARLRPPVTVRFDETVSSPLIVEHAFDDGTVTSPDSATWMRELESSETAFNSLVRLPATAGEYDITGTLFELSGDNWLTLKSHVLELALPVEHDALAADAMEALAGFEVARQYETRRDQAMALVHEATLLPQTNGTDAEEAITLLLDAVVKLQAIPNSAEPIGAIGRLMQSYQLALVEQ